MIQTARKHGVDIATVENALDSGTPVGSMIFSILASVAELELSLIRQRTRDSFERRRALGLRWGGNPPYGLQWREGHAAPDQHLPAVRFIFERRAKGDSVLQIARRLNEKAKADGADKPRTAGRWSESSPEVVASILRNASAYRPHVPNLPDVPQ